MARTMRAGPGAVNAGRHGASERLAPTFSALFRSRKRDVKILHIAD
jgi:hypothetical protein